MHPSAGRRGWCAAAGGARVSFPVAFLMLLWAAMHWYAPMHARGSIAITCVFFFRMDAQIGKRPTSSTKEEMKRASSRRAPSSKRNFSSRQASLSDCSVETVMALVKEVTRSKDETIRAKEHTIKLLESFMDMTGAH